MNFCYWKAILGSGNNYGIIIENLQYAERMLKD